MPSLWREITGLAGFPYFMTKFTEFQGKASGKLIATEDKFYYRANRGPETHRSGGPPFARRRNRVIRCPPAAACRLDKEVILENLNPSRPEWSEHKVVI